MTTFSNSGIIYFYASIVYFIIFSIYILYMDRSTNICTEDGKGSIASTFWEIEKRETRFCAPCFLPRIAVTFMRFPHLLLLIFFKGMRLYYFGASIVRYFIYLLAKALSDHSVKMKAAPLILLLLKI